MRVFRYLIELQDFLFYAQEAIAGTVTPRWLHATAINYALAYAINLLPEKQPYFMFTQEGRNVPEYTSSLIAEAGFYATPARVEGMRAIKPTTFLIKGDREGYCVKNPPAEVLRISRVTMLPPGTCFSGFLLCRQDMAFPSSIRLGRFRSPAFLTKVEATIIKLCENRMVSHPVDPLVSTTRKGVLIPILPYPLVDRACVHSCLAVKVGNQEFFVAQPDEW
ncbi:MAG: hypothetical protein QXG33_04250 [Candidatus Anstonellales archaeon]